MITLSTEQISAIATTRQVEEHLHKRLSEARTIAFDLERKFLRKFRNEYKTPWALRWLLTSHWPPLRIESSGKDSVLVQVFYDNQWVTVPQVFYTQGTWAIAQYTRRLMYQSCLAEQAKALSEEQKAHKYRGQTLRDRRMVLERQLKTATNEEKFHDEKTADFFRRQRNIDRRKEQLKKRETIS